MERGENMATYNVEVTETLSRVVEQEARNYEEAEKLVMEKYDEEEIVLDWNDCDEVKYKIYPSPMIKNNLSMFISYSKKDKNLCITNCFDLPKNYECETKEYMELAFKSFINDSRFYIDEVKEAQTNQVIEVLKEMMDEMYKEYLENSQNLIKKYHEEKIEEMER